MLRSENTKLCVEITLSALKKFDKKGVFEFFPKNQKEDIIPLCQMF